MFGLGGVALLGAATMALGFGMARTPEGSEGARDRGRRLLRAVGRGVPPWPGRDRIARRLAWVGWDLTPEAFVGAQVLAALAAGALGATAAAAAGLGPAGGALLGGVAGLVGWELPTEALGARYRAARAALGREALGYGDFLVACLRAGLPLEAAMRRLGRELPGRLARALAQLVTRAVDAKDGLDAALYQAAREWDEPTVGALLGVVVQAHATGGDLAAPLSGLLAALHQERHQRLRAEARARAATGFVPLLFVFLPGVLAPVVFVVWRTLSSAGF